MKKNFFKIVNPVILLQQVVYRIASYWCRVATIYYIYITSLVPMQPTHSFSAMLTAEKWGLGQTLSYIPAPTHKHPDIHTHT